MSMLGAVETSASSPCGSSRRPLSLDAGRARQLKALAVPSSSSMSKATAQSPPDLEIPPLSANVVRRRDSHYGGAPSAARRPSWGSKRKRPHPKGLGSGRSGTRAPHRKRRRSNEWHGPATAEGYSTDLGIVVSTPSASMKKDSQRRRVTSGYQSSDLEEARFLRSTVWAGEVACQQARYLLDRACTDLLSSAFR